MEQYSFPVSIQSAFLFSNKKPISRLITLKFGLGSRGCMGKNISLLEIGKVMPQLVRRFDFELEEPQKELHCVNYWFVKQTDLRCRLSIRRQ